MRHTNRDPRTGRYVARQSRVLNFALALIPATLVFAAWVLS